MAQIIDLEHIVLNCTEENKFSDDETSQTMFTKN